MKKNTAPEDDPLDREIDFSNARPNPFAAGFSKSRNVRVLAPDLLEHFPDSESVNTALRALVAGAEPKKRISAKTARARKSSK